MLQYKVPQNVQRDDELLPFLTMKQLIILAIGGGFSYVLFSILSQMFFIEIWGPIVFIPVVFTVATAFVKINGISFPKWFMLIIEYSLIPQKRIWNNKTSVEKYIKAIITSTPKKSTTKKNIKKEKPKTSLKKFIKNINTNKDQHTISHHAVNLNQDLFDEEDNDALLRINSIIEKKQKYKNIEPLSL